MDDLDYPAAARALDAAWQEPGNDRPTVLRILEMQGIVAASTGREEAAVRAFRLLVSLDPGHTLRKKFGPKVMTPFYAAKGWVADRGALRFDAGPPVTGRDQVEAILARLLADPLKVVRKVRFHVLTGEGAPREQEMPIKRGLARLQVKGEPVKWWAELLGDNDAVLELLGTEAKPVVDSALHPREVVEATPEPEIAAEEGPPGPPAAPLTLTPRTLSYGAFGGAAVALGVGIAFGVGSSQERAQIKNAATDSAGRVVGLTQRQAYALDAKARGNAVAANLFFAGAGALAATGGVLWWLGAPVGVAPTGDGVAIAGRLP